MSLAPALLLIITLASVQAEAPRSADAGVAGIQFLDPTSAIARVGENPVLTNEHPAFAHARYVNDDRSESLALIFHPGGEGMAVAEAIVEEAPRGSTLPRFPGGTSHFTSTRGIRLGISRAQVTQILGPADSQSKDVLEYRITQEAGGQWLREFDMPVYYGTYEFRDAKLISFSFGFEYP